jgi:hypothetical protein
MLVINSSLPYKQYEEKPDSGVRGNSDDETPSVTAQSVNKHAVTLVNKLDSRRSFLLKYAPINAINILATKSRRTLIIQTDTEKILDIMVNRNSCFPHRANHTVL